MPSYAEILAYNGACSLLSRLYMGQWGEVTYTRLLHGLSTRPNPDVEDLLRRASSIGHGLSAGAYWAIRSPSISDRARVAFDIHQVLRKQLATEGGADSWSVSLDAFQQLSKQPKPELVVLLPGREYQLRLNEEQDSVLQEALAAKDAVLRGKVADLLTPLATMGDTALMRFALAEVDTRLREGCVAALDTEPCPSPH